MKTLIAFALAAVAWAAPSAELLEAAKAGSKEQVRKLIAAKADVNSTEADGTTALMWAAYHDDVESADALLKAGANPNLANDLGATPLWAAAQNGGTAMVKRLLEAGADPNKGLESGETPLMIAARGGYPEAMELLIAKGAKVDTKGPRQQTALMWAAAQKHPAAVRVLVKHKANIQDVSGVYYEVMAVVPHGYLPYNRPIPHGGETALMFAARVGDAESAKILVEAGANVNDTDAWGMSAVTLAAHSGFADVVEYLLDKKANPNFMFAGISALHNAIMRRSERMVKALLDHGANPNDQVRTWTPLRRSADDWNFDPNLVGTSPLWLAARLGEPGIVKMLLAKGADAKFVHHVAYVAEVGFGSAEREESSSVLMAATGMAKINDFVELPVGVNREPATLETAKLLVEAGADLNLKALDGKTALDAARTQRFQSVISYLIEKGAQGAPVPAGGAPGGRGGAGGPRPAGPKPAPAK
jgi:ankyrin repeat protein